MQANQLEEPIAARAQKALRYVLITPARDEARYIRKTLEAMIRQTMLPVAWVIVSDGSTDGTDEIIEQYASRFEWIIFLRMPERRERHFAGKVGAFYAGYEQLKDVDYDIIGNLDGDSSFDADYIEYLLKKFAENPRLGVAGTNYIEDEWDKSLKHDYRFSNIEDVTGQCQLFRKECFEAIGGYKPSKAGGIDLIATLSARMNGWQTRVFTDKLLFHHRQQGTAQFFKYTVEWSNGTKDYLFGSHPLWEVCRASYRLTKKPYLVGGILLFAGYFWALLTRRKKTVSREFVRFRRTEQLKRLQRIARNLIFRRRQALPDSPDPAVQSSVEVRIRGREMIVPAVSVRNRTILIKGKWLKVATLQDELFLEGEPVDAPEEFIRSLRLARTKADIFEFSQKITDAEPKHSYFFEWDNVAAAPTRTYEDWWMQRIPQEARKNVRRAEKRGVIVRSVAVDDRFIDAIMKIYNETKVRQGKPFWHYGKDFETIKKETITFPERSEFFGAYLNGELIGFIKLVFCGDVAALMAIVSLNSRHDCRPNNALLAKAVEICASKGMSYLVYGKYVYGNNMNSALTEFKRRNGFEALRFPRYYVPLTWKGRLVLLLKLHRGWVGILPPRMLALFVGVRAKVFQSLGALRRVRAEEAVDAKSE